MKRQDLDLLTDEQLESLTCVEHKALTDILSQRDVAGAKAVTLQQEADDAIRVLRNDHVTAMTNLHATHEDRYKKLVEEHEAAVTHLKIVRQEQRDQHAAFTAKLAESQASLTAANERIAALERDKAEMEHHPDVIAGRIEAAEKSRQEAIINLKAKLAELVGTE